MMLSNVRNFVDIIFIIILHSDTTGMSQLKIYYADREIPVPKMTGMFLTGSMNCVLHEFITRQEIYV